MRIVNLSAIIVTVFIIITGCNTSSVYEKNYDFNDEVWHVDSSLIFDVTIEDSLQVYNIYLHNRITGQYPYSNLYLFVTTIFPDSTVIRDTMECILAEPNGKWLGKGFGNIWSNKIPYRKHVRFPYTGTYKFEIEQAMRVEELPHILDAGLNIEIAK